MLLCEIYRRSVEAQPDNVFLVCDRQTLTFRQFDAMVDSYARALLGLGVVRGDRVALCADNRVELAVLYFACFRMGAAAVGISCYSAKTDTIYNLTNSGAKIFIVDRPHWEQFESYRDELSGIAKIYSLDQNSGRGGLLWADVLDRSRSGVLWPEVTESDPATIVYTSGSTSRPKGVTHTQHSLLAMSMNRCESFRLGIDSRMINSGSLTHAAATTMTLIPALACGGMAIFMSHFSPEAFVSLVAKHKVTHAAAGPGHVREILKCQLIKDGALDSLKYFSCGGDQVPDSLFEQFRQTVGFELTESIGMTECGTYLTTIPGEPGKRGSLGKPVANTLVRLFDGQGHEVPVGTIGEIVVRSDAVMAGYWQDEENTAKTILDGWLHTGDLGTQDVEGYFYFAGRIKNIIVRECGNVSPSEVEDTIHQHPLVKESAVLGIPDGDHGQAICAFVVLREGDEEGDADIEKRLTKFVADRLMFIKVPQHWCFLKEFPITSLGKLDRAVLQKMALDKWSNPKTTEMATNGMGAR